jgi:hypothetical protein
MIKNSLFLMVVIFFLYYLIGLLFHFLLLTFQKEEWIKKVGLFFHLVYPHLFKVFFLSLLSGLLFLWIQTLLNIPATTIFYRFLSFVSSFSFAILVSAIQGWLSIKGFEVIGKYQLPQNSNEVVEKNPTKFIQPMIFFIGIILILSVILDFFLTFFISPLTTGYLFVKLVKLSCTLKI